MAANAAELIFYGELSVDRFFAEADRLGIPVEALRETATYNRVLQSCLTRIRTQVAMDIAAELQLPLPSEQAEKIARHSLVPSVSLEPVPLDAEEARLAEELYFHAVKAAMARKGEAVSDRSARRASRQLVRDGQRGPGWLQPWLEARGCAAPAALMALLLTALAALPLLL